MLRPSTIPKDNVNEAGTLAKTVSNWFSPRTRSKCKAWIGRLTAISSLSFNASK